MLLESEVTLTRDELLVTRPNYQVVCVETYISDNKHGYPYFAFCWDDTLSIRKSTLICLYKNNWHNVNLHKRWDPILGTPAPGVNLFDTIYSDPKKDLEDGLREATKTHESSPQKVTTSPIPSTMSLEYEPEGFRDWAIPEQLCTEPFLITKMVTTTQLQPISMLQTFLQGGLRPPSPTPPPTRPGSPSGGPPRGPPRGPPGGQGPPPPIAPPGIVPQPAVQDVKPMGKLPTIFNGDWSKSKGFLDKLRRYFLLNHQILALWSYLTRIALALTLIQGPLVKEWARNHTDWLERMTPLEDKLDIWRQFTQQFISTFTDTQKDQQACNQLESLKMKWPEVDQYTMDFEKLMREASYRLGTPESIQMYLKGLPSSIMKDVLRAPTATTYEQTIKWAADSVKSQQLIQSLERMRGIPQRFPPHTNLWQNFGGQRNPLRTTPSTQALLRPSYNSTTTPRMYNNQPVPMDLSRTQGNRGQGQRQYWGNTASTSQPVKGNCYNCGIAGHFSWDCWKPRRTCMATVQQTEQTPTEASDDATLIDWCPRDNKTTAVQSTTQAFLAMSPEDQGEVIAQIGAGELQDFQTAWSTWPWSGLLAQNVHTCQIASLCQ